MEPQRQILHGLLGDVDFAELSELPSKDKVPYALRMMDGARLSPRMAASLVEVGNTLATWPQLVGEVALSATLVAEAVRRIGLGEELPSGRVRVDVAQRPQRDRRSRRVEAGLPTTRRDQQTDTTPTDAVERVVAAAVRAPSGGNAQPWHVSTQDGSVTIALAPETPRRWTSAIERAPSLSVRLHSTPGWPRLPAESSVR